MKNIIIYIAVLIGLTNAAFAEQLQLVQYADTSKPQVLDVKPAGPSIGDMYASQGAFRSSIGGPVIGEYFAQATLVYVDQSSKRTLRSYLVESVYPDGSIYKLDLIQTDHGAALKDGHNHSGAIVGGTGKYAGIRGSYEFEVLDGGVAKVTNSYWLGQ
ncbi:MAG: hypothetical protein P8J17_02925 [Halioglobus sp.]|nr:hypothetical protein [Halioglobus sp.]